MRTSRLHPTDIPHIIANGRRTLTALATPCTCGRENCTTGQHLWYATRDAQPDGRRAHAFDQSRTSNSTTAPIPTIDRHAITTHNEVRAHLATLTATLSALDVLATTWNPHRGGSADTANDDDWCRHHLDTIGVCEPRFRGDLCRPCYMFQLAEKAPPTVDILDAWRHGRRVTPAMVNEARSKRRKKKGKKK